MSCCSIYNKSFLADANLDTAQIEISKLKSLIGSFDTPNSGLWKPIVIQNSLSTITYGDPLTQPDSTLNSSFNPCSCSPTIASYDEIETNDSFRCSYCSSVPSNTNHSISWKLKDTNNNESSTLVSNCCNGACDVRMDKDDYLPKIPVLNQKYLNKFYDFKHMQQFPAIGSGLGFFQFIKFSNDGLGALNSFTNTSSTPQLCIDWELKPRMAEIPYDSMTSQYDNEDDHNKAYQKYTQTGKTCGNFILTKIYTSNENNVSYSTNTIFSGLMGLDSEVNLSVYPLEPSTVSRDIATLLPSATAFNNLAYGFAQNTYNNIFVKTEKLGSYWRWNYSSGVIGWYRYYDKDRKNDQRPIPGVDLYISPGDVFYARNDGPEPISETVATPDDGSQVIKSCPSGIKLIKNNTVVGVIPSGSYFTHISANIYPLMLEIYDRIDSADKTSKTKPNSMTTLQKFELAALLSTAPQYDAVTVDLFKTTDLDASQINTYRQRKQLNQDMSTSSIGSVNHMNFISSKYDLIHTLGNKYGSYLWCPPQSTSILEFLDDIDSQAYIDLSFDMNVKVNDTRRFSSCQSTMDCLDSEIPKEFAYNQAIELSNLKIESKIKTRKRYAATCSDGVMTQTQSANMAGIFLNDHLLKEVVYFSGCSIFQNTYPRPIIDTPTISCSACEDGSSYKLALKLNSSLCSNFQGEASFCDATLARFYNNSQGVTVGTRLARTILDGSLYDKRKYNAAVLNPRIDKAAFHHQGGVYYDSKVFGANNSTVFSKNISSLTNGKCRITFATKDAGIKIYNLKIDKLRSSNSDTYECLGFPNQNNCQCFPINTIADYPYICDDGGSITYSNEPLLFTPNLSTVYSPVFKAYGGFADTYLISLIGDSRIPNHPDIGSSLAVLNKKINPEQPYGCSQSISINLSNYFKTEWSFSLPSYDTNHADVWAEVVENVDLFRPTNYTTTTDEDGNSDITASPNVGYQRFATRVTLNDSVSIYDKQKKILFTKAGGSASSVSATLTNPYLEALTGQEFVLYPPSGNFCSTNNVFGTLGDQSIDLSIKFSRIPRKQILNFAIRSPVAMGVLKKGFFHPNSGLIYGGNNTDVTSVVRDNTLLTSYIDYDKELFRPDDTYEQGQMLIGEINDKLKETLRQISEFDNHKKLRLYLSINNQWHEYNDPNIFGFLKGEEKYIGQPYLFEYTEQDNLTNLPGPILPVSPKEYLNFNFFYNFTYLFNSKFKYNNNFYPITNTKFVRKITKTKIRIEGSRPYFLVAEQERDDRLYTNFSDLQIDYNIKNKMGYVYNTKKTCDQKVILFSIENPKLYYISRIIEKSIYSISVDKNGNVLNYNDNTTDKYLKIYTEFVFDSNVKYSQGYLDFSLLGILPEKIDNDTDWEDTFNISEDVDLGSDSLIIYQDIPEALKSELDSMLRNPLYITKWGDMLGFDGKLINELGEYIHNNDYINSKYPESLYKNNFIKTIINNCNTQLYNYNLKTKTKTGQLKDTLLSYNGVTSYVIHQKYNIGDGNNSLARQTFRDNHNYLPFMDINFLPDYGSYDNSARAILKPLLKDMLQDSSKICSGLIQISGVYKNFDNDHKWENNYLDPNNKELFFIDLNRQNKLKSAITIQPDKVVYSNTFRIDDVPFQLYSIESTQVINNAGINRSFLPNVPTETITFPANKFDFGHFQNIQYTSKPFITFPIYGDTDTLGTCSSVRCGINTIGSVSFSGIYSIQMPKMKSLSSELNNIPYIISYDAGLYNPIGNHQLHYIQRLELDPNNPLYTTNTCDNSVSPRPTINRISVLNEEYQNIMQNSIVDDHSDEVKNTDILANEMLFRLMYGEKQKINLKTVDSSNDQTIKFNDLIKYTDPKIEAKDLYNNIPYDLDTTADSSDRKISGSLSINGILRVGKTISVTIGNKNITLSIVRDSGKIKIQAVVDGKTIESIIHTEYTVNNNLVVSSSPLGNTSSTEYNLLKICQELGTKSISLWQGFTSAKIYNATKCDGTKGISFPYWKMMDRATQEQAISLQNQIDALRLESSSGRSNDIAIDSLVQQLKNLWSAYQCSPGNWNGGDNPVCNPNYPPGDIPFIATTFTPGCAWTSAVPTYGCTNRGITLSVKDSISSNCNILTLKTKNIKLGKVARGTFGGCYAEGSIGVTPRNEGSIEDVIGGIIINQPVGVPNSRSPSVPVCGTCFTHDYIDPITNNRYFSSVNGRVHPPAGGDTNEHCECADWEYGYCRNSNNAAYCVCSTLQYDYTPFDYNFEYCRYNISLKGHKRRIKYTEQNQLTINRTPFCSTTQNGVIAGSFSDYGGDATEECAWIECDGGPAAKWYIYDAVSISQQTLYNPSCPVNLCSITYDNNTLTINLPSGPSQCITQEIRDNCPVVRVVVPDNSFTVLDSISSNCDSCGVKPNKINMTAQTQNWDIVTETRTCMLGYFLISPNPNEDGPVNMGTQTIGCGYCSICCSDQCCVDEDVNSGLGLCGKEAPESFPWTTCISFEGPSLCTGGNTRYPRPTVAGCDIRIGFPASHPIALNRMIELWKQQMDQTLKNTAPCYNNKTLNLNDIVEGVVPGSCSQEVLYTSVTYPAMKYRATLADPVFSETSVTYTVAYYTYSYRRPKTIQDILKTDEVRIKCNDIRSSCPSTAPVNTSEVYKTVDCNSAPGCYNTDIPKCDNDNYCCRAGKTNYE